MEVILLSKDFVKLRVLDTYNSLIWTERYNECGDFEIEVSDVEQSLKHMTKDRYLISSDHDTVMIIEDFDLTTDVKKGDKLIITGQTLESILKRRIIHDLTNISGSLEEGIKKILDDAIINPTDVNRKIDNFIFEYSGDSRIQTLTMDKQFHGENVYDAISSECKTHQLGFKVRLVNGQFIFSLYMGDDHTRSQSENRFIEFSSKYNNLINSNYYEQNGDVRNFALVGGEGQGAERRVYPAENSTHSGMDRREIFVDAASISSQTQGGLLSDEEYNKKLEERGLDRLSSHKKVRVFDGVIEQVNIFKYRRDYFLGDKVQFTNNYGINATVRITEVITSHDDTGLTIYPSFIDFEL